MRRTVTVKIEEEGRDKGKVFLIEEMPADVGERWALQVLYLWSQIGVTMPQGVQEAGMAGLAAVGVDFLTIAQARALTDPSLDVMWDYIKYQHAPDHPPQKIVSGANCQIDEIRTRKRLREEVLKLHLVFFQDGNSPSSGSSPPSPVS